MHTDHLGTPRAISNNSNQVVWRWEGDQFGDVLATGNLTFPIRHAGQYYDAEVNIFYFRDYDPITGRYVESDPIGLDGGLNTYGYVGGDVLRAVDPRGEFAMVLPAVCAGGGCAAAASAIINTIGIIAIWERPWRQRDTWHVYTRCNTKKQENCENCPDTIGGHGYGKSYREALINAQHDANANLGLQKFSKCQAKHCWPRACFKNGISIRCPSWS